MPVAGVDALCLLQGDDVPLTEQTVSQVRARCQREGGGFPLQSPEPRRCLGLGLGLVPPLLTPALCRQVLQSAKEQIKWSLLR